LLRISEPVEKTKTTPMIDVPIFFPRLVPCLLVAIAVATICPGCGDRRLPIQGEVTFNGRPVEEGTISLEPADGIGPTTGGEIAAGKYRLIGVAAPLPGKKIVRISAVRKTGRKIAAGPPSPPGILVDEIDRYIPNACNARSSLSCEVSDRGPKQINFHLKSP
jgi:hypothetical protein